MMEAKIIKTEKEYNEALNRIEFLMDKVSLDKRETDELELFGKLVSLYENEKWPVSPPHPVDAIRFRMEQEGLTQNDLVKYIGNKSKVSEILSGKRSLSKQMIVNLHQGLGIPLESLLSGTEDDMKDSGDTITETIWLKFPVKEMIKKGWISTQKVKDEPGFYKAIIKSFAAGLSDEMLSPVLLRSCKTHNRNPDPYALAAWRIRVISLAKKVKLDSKFDSKLITPTFSRELAKLSYLEQGPLLAREFLNKSGIHLIIETHLSHTYLDGASMVLADGSPLIALTLRYDRLDNFWFVLFHELAHVALHLSYDHSKYFLEDLEHISDDIEEQEADKWAMDALIAEEIWKASGLNPTSSYADIINFAKSLRVSAAIPAGRIRKEAGDYKIFARLVGTGSVRKLF